MSKGPKPFRTFFIGSVSSSDVALEALLADPAFQMLGVLTLSDSKVNADYADIAVRARANGMPVHLAEQIDTEALVDLLSDLQPDVVFVIGWSRLLGAEVLRIPKLGAIGYHPAALPANRGRHPLIWALALGLEETASSFFLMEEGADSGPILSQVSLPIAATDYASDLYAKALKAIPTQLQQIRDHLRSGLQDLLPQDHNIATYWRKRGRVDGMIDWRMAATSIYNLVRALAHPYPGAEFMVGDQAVTLWRCEVVEADVPKNAEPGKILAVENGHVLVKAGVGALRLLHTSGLPASIRQGDYL